MSWALATARRLLKRTMEKNKLVPSGEQLLVAVSGGIDSLCLLQLLVDHKARRRCGWHIRAVHIDPGFPGWNSERVVRACVRIGVECSVARLDVPALLKVSVERPCYVCSRARRRRLFELAHEGGFSRLALGHHMEDVNETFLMNLIFSASGTTCLMSQSLFRNALTIVRPLYYFDDEIIRRYAKASNIRPVRNRCPYERSGTRRTIRLFLDRLHGLESRTTSNLFSGIHNLKPDYLPPQRGRERLAPHKTKGGADAPPDSPMGI